MFLRKEKYSFISDKKKKDVEEKARLEKEAAKKNAKLQAEQKL